MRKTHSLVRIAIALLDRPDEQHWSYDLSRRSGVRAGVTTPILWRMLDAGWVADGWEDRSEGGRPPRRYYVLTKLGRVELAALLEQARQDQRFQGLNIQEVNRA